MGAVYGATGGDFEGIVSIQSAHRPQTFAPFGQVEGDAVGLPHGTHHNEILGFGIQNRSVKIKNKGRSPFRYPPKLNRR
jgi:hypothetical protein